jgi:hypothetical protein
MDASIFVAYIPKVMSAVVCELSLRTKQHPLGRC